MVLGNASTLIAPKDTEYREDGIAIVTFGLVSTFGLAYIANNYGYIHIRADCLPGSSVCHLA